MGVLSLLSSVVEMAWPSVIDALLSNLMHLTSSFPVIMTHSFCTQSVIDLSVNQSTGQLFSKKETSKIFDPFYTTKPPGEGTGLGLWLTYEIVNIYGGEITVKSEKDEGTTFSVKFDCKCEAT